MTFMFGGTSVPSFGYTIEMGGAFAQGARLGGKAAQPRQSGLGSTPTAEAADDDDDDDGDRDAPELDIDPE